MHSTTRRYNMLICIFVVVKFSQLLPRTVTPARQAVDNYCNWWRLVEVSRDFHRGGV